MIGKVILAVWGLGELTLQWVYWGQDRNKVTKVSKIGVATLLGSIIDATAVALGVIYW
jgi:hypothetical protein